MSERKLIVCNPAIFFEDNAPAVYPWILDKLGRGEEAQVLQKKYDSIKVNGPGLLSLLAELFKGINQIDMECRQYCWEYGRREVFELFRRFNDRGHRCMPVTSLPEELCEEFANITSMISVPRHMFVASQVLTCPQALIGNTEPKKVNLVDRNSRKEIALGLIEIMLEHHYKHQFRGWEDVLVIGQSLTDIPLGKAVQEKGGRFVAFHPKDTDIMKVVDHTYGDVCTLERAFQLERLLIN
jgi:hypothetical protein